MAAPGPAEPADALGSEDLDDGVEHIVVGNLVGDGNADGDVAVGGEGRKGQAGLRVLIDLRFGAPLPPGCDISFLVVIGVSW